MHGTIHRIMLQSLHVDFLPNIIYDVKFGGGGKGIWAKGVPVSTTELGPFWEREIKVEKQDTREYVILKLKYNKKALRGLQPVFPFTSLPYHLKANCQRSQLYSEFLEPNMHQETCLLWFSLLLYDHSLRGYKMSFQNLLLPDV